MVRILFAIPILAATWWLVFGIPCQKVCLAESDYEVADMANARTNPFLTKQEAKEYAESGNCIPLDYLQLSAVFFSQKEAESRAIIDGKVFEKGDSIDNKEIIQINPENVILKDVQGQYVVKMKQVIMSAEHKK